MFTKEKNDVMSFNIFSHDVFIISIYFDNN